MPRTSEDSLLTFIAASLTLVVCFTASSAPIPLMSVYQNTLGLAPDEIANSLVAYYAGCILTLVLFARMSNYFGRKPVVLFTLAMGILGCALFVMIDSVGILYFARFFQGLGCGLASSAAMAWVVDTAPSKQRWLGTTLTAAAPPLGLCMGTLLTGVFVDLGWFDASELFLFFIGLMSVVFALCAMSKETVPFGMESFRQVLIPKLTVPTRLRRLFIVGAAAYIGAWGIGSFFQGFSATMSSMAFGTSSTFLGAMTYLILMIPNTTTGLIIGRFNAARVLRVVVTILLVASALIFYSLNQSWATGFLLVVALLGVANGGCCTAGLKIVIQDTTLEERAGTIGAIYLSAYVGSGIPNLVIGQLGKTTSMDTLGIGYTFWSFLAFAIVHGMLFWIRQTASDTEKKAVL